MKKLIISCDDLGISEEVNLGIQDCLEKRVATSSSIIANGEFYEHALKSVVNQDVIQFYGLHLNLTEGKALNKDSINILSDESNKFKISSQKYFLLNFLKLNKTFKSAVYNEFKSQIKKVLNDGIKLSHFDSHEYIHHSPWIFKIISDLGKEFKINKIRFVNEKIIIRNYFKNIYYKLKSLNYFKHFIINICNKKIKNNFVSPDYFFGILNSGKTKKDELFLYLDCLNSDKTVELCIHPANRLMDQMNIKKNINQRNFYKNENRINEKNLLLSDEFRNFLTHKKINLINFSEIS